MANEQSGGSAAPSGGVTRRVAIPGLDGRLRSLADSLQLADVRVWLTTRTEADGTGTATIHAATADESVSASLDVIPSVNAGAELADMLARSTDDVTVKLKGAVARTLAGMRDDDLDLHAIADHIEGKE